MRTRTDLNGAFALLEIQADNYFTAEDSAGEAGRGEVTVDLVSVSVAPHRTGTRRRFLAAFAAAATVAAITVAGATQLGGHDGSRAEQATAQDSPPGTVVPVGVVPFTIVRGTGLTITHIESSAGFTSVDLVDGRARYVVAFYSIKGAAHPTPGLERADVNGLRGYWSPGRRPAMGDGPDNKAQPTDGAQPRAINPPAMVWEYAAGLWAELSPVRTATADRNQLLHAAEALDTTQSSPVLVSFTLDRAPAGMHLDGVDSTYCSLDPNQSGPFVLDDRNTRSDASYTANVRKGTVSFVASADPQDFPFPDAAQVKVDGHPGLYDAQNSALSISIGRMHIWVQVQGDATDESHPQAAALAELEALIRTVHLVPNASNSTNWLNAKHALPAK